MRLRGCLATQIRAGGRGCLTEEAGGVTLRPPASGRAFAGGYLPAAEKEPGVGMSVLFLRLH